MIIQIKDLPIIREKNRDAKIVFTAGSFDLTHAGHALFFEDCKRYGDILVVMIGNDFNMRAYKGVERPILNESIRLKMVDSLKPVDYTLLDINAENKDFLAILRHVFVELKPNFYVINEDAFDMPRRRILIEGTGTELVILKRICPPEFEEISTSKIIKKIKGEK